MNTSGGEGALAGKELGRSFQSDPPPTTIVVDSPPSSMRVPGMVLGVPKILNTLSQLTTSPLYVASEKLFLAYIPQYLCTLDRSLAAQSDEVGFFKLAPK